MYPFIGELLTNSSRSKFMLVVGYALGLGILCSTGFGWIVHRFDIRVTLGQFEIQPWRWHMIFALLPASLATLIYCFLPESPVYLSHMGDNAKVMKVLRSIHEKNGNGLEKFPLQSTQLEVVKTQSRKM